MHIDPVAVIGALVLTLLAVLLTGPGMWSEKWGWGWLKGRRRAPEAGGPSGDSRSPERGDRSSR